MCCQTFFTQNYLLNHQLVIDRPVVKCPADKSVPVCENTTKTESAESHNVTVSNILFANFLKFI